MTARPHRHPIAVAGWCELVALIVAETPALPSALCRRAPPQLFDGDSTEARAAAIKICRCCPEIQRCRQWVAALPPSRRVSGVTAGRFRR